MFHQWVLSVPKRLRYYLDEPAILNAALHIFLHAVEQNLRRCSPGATPESRIGAVVFIHRFGGLLNPHLALHSLRSHFHAIVVDGVFAAGSESAEEVGFTEARIDPNALERIHAQVRKRLLSTFARRGLIEKDEAQTMLSWEHDRRKSLWDEVFPLQCPKCGGEMHIIAFINEAQVVRKILTHLGEPTSPPRMALARGPPLWEAAMAGQSSNDPLAQPEPAYEFDQRIAW